MYAVIKTGGKQERVEPGQVLNVERLGASVGDEVTLTPVLVVDGDTVLATKGQLAGASVTAKVVGEAKGPKITGFKYKNKSNQRKRWGHRQHYDATENTKISKGWGGTSCPSPGAAVPPGTAATPPHSASA